MRWLAAAVASCIAFCFVCLGTLVPLTGPAGTQYLFVWPGLAVLTGAAAAVASTLIGFYFLILHRARLVGPENVDSARSARWLAPLVALAIMPAGVLPAIPGAGEPFAVFGYFFYDLRWWWLAVAVSWVAIRVDPIVEGPIVRSVRAIQAWSPTAR